MNKADFIKEYGEEAYVKQQEQTRVWRMLHPTRIHANSQEQNCKGGKRYRKRLIYNRTGLRGKRRSIRGEHQKLYRSYKNIIDPDGLTQIHHEWIQETADYRGVALVEANSHMHGYIDVIQILEGEITLLVETEIGRI